MSVYILCDLHKNDNNKSGIEIIRTRSDVNIETEDLHSLRSPWMNRSFLLSESEMSSRELQLSSS